MSRRKKSGVATRKVATPVVADTPVTAETSPDDAPRRVGRPSGPASEKPPVAVLGLTRCPRCGSTEREKYFNRRSMPIEGVGPDGLIYTHITWRRTTCRICGQQRDDKSYEVRSPCLAGMQDASVEE